MADRSLDSLSSDFAPRAYEWIARVTSRGVPVLVVQTSRTMSEHQQNLLNETSGTALSLHLPRRMRWKPDMLTLDPRDAEKSDAMDIAPYAQFQLHGPDKLQWNTRDPAWGVIVEEAERVGLRSGGRWRSPHDPGHAEFVLPWKEHYLADERSRPWPWAALNA
jgi:hypothetical protein